MNVTQRYATLDGLRGVAAFFVVCYHTHIFRGSSAIAPHGYLAVDFFFLLSGFVIASAYEKKIVAGFTVTEFFKHRVIRLYPIALAGVLLGALRLLAHYTINPFESEPAPWIALAILLNVLILPLWSQTHFRGELFPANGPVWSLFGEFLVNLGWSVLASLKLPFTVIALLLAASGIKLFSLMHHVALDDLVSTRHGDLSIPRRAAEFIQQTRDAPGHYHDRPAAGARHAVVRDSVGCDGNFFFSSGHPDARRDLRARVERAGPGAAGRNVISGLCHSLSDISSGFRISTPDLSIP
jgi:peptidoglycan/LPS O-acetylase OafA/YrhL